jgi:hypothetical protein
MTEATVDIISNSYDRLPITPVPLSPVVNICAINQTDECNAVVAMVDKLEEGKWTRCMTDRTQVAYSSRKELRVDGDYEFIEAELLGKSCLQFNQMKQDKARVKVEGEAIFMNKIHERDGLYLSGIVTLLEPGTDMEGLRCNMNVTQQSQGSSLYRMTCFDVNAGTAIFKFFCGIVNGGGKKKRINIYKNQLQSLHAWQETNNLEADRKYIFDALDALEDDDAYTIEDAKNLFVSKDAQIVQHCHTYTNVAKEPIEQILGKRNRNDVDHLPFAFQVEEPPIKRIYVDDNAILDTQDVEAIYSSMGVYI